jgi:hypothetical protein
MYVPFFIPFRYPVRNLFVYNFATVNGNHDVGIYNDEFKLLTSTGAVAQAGTSTIQFHAKDIILEPGQYYFALSSSSTTATYATMQSGTITRHRYLGIMQQLTAHPLPASATPTALSAGNVKVTAMGFTFMTGTPSF